MENAPRRRDEIAEIPIAITLAGAPIVAVEADISLPAPLTYTFAPLVRGELQDVRGSVETIPGGLRLRFVARPGQTIGDGEVGVIALSVAADTDERPLHLVVTGARAFGPDGKAISLTTANGSVTIASTATPRRRAGAFFFGRFRSHKLADGRCKVEAVPRGEWIALLPGAHEGNILWDEYESNQRQLLEHVQPNRRDVEKMSAHT